jgi:hypothetical protein
MAHMAISETKSPTTPATTAAPSRIITLIARPPGSLALQPILVQMHCGPNAVKPRVIVDG